ncbi:hypothetical protein ACXGQW_00825 [Wenyingzhuangia sp. IMCC45533]
MKKRILLITLIGMSFGIKAQEKIQTETGLKNDFIYKNGNIGIGTTNPLSKLEIKGGNLLIRNLNNSDNSSAVMIAHSINHGEYDTFGTSLRTITQSAGNNTYGMQFFTQASYSNGQTEKMRITGNGNVGIGTATPDSRLEVNGSIKSSRLIASTTQNNIPLIQLFDSTNNIDWNIENGRTGVGDLGFYNDGTKFVIKNNGNIGIGITTPNAKLHINNGNNSYGSILANANESKFSLYTKTLTTQPTDVESFRLGLKYDNDENNGFISFYRGQSGSGGFLGFSTFGAERVRITRNGDVGIGTIDTKGYKLGVNGKIAATEVKVALYNNWADFVFDKNYNLPTLTEVENYIREKGHLKDIPNAEEVKNNGIHLGEMDTKLLQKIEELTLYAIEQGKKIKELELLNLRLIQIQKRLEKLEAK